VVRLRRPTTAEFSGLEKHYRFARAGSLPQNSQTLRELPAGVVRRLREEPFWRALLAIAELASTSVRSCLVPGELFLAIPERCGGRLR
jgi:hypothetical protein